MDGRRIGHQRIKTVKDTPAIGIQLVKRARTRQHFHRPLADPLQIHPPRQIKERGKRHIATPVRDQLHRIRTHILERAQPIDHTPLGHREGRHRAVHAGRHDLDLQTPAHLFGINRQLVGQMNIAIHHARHEFDRMVRLQPRRLIADNRIGGRVRFVEPVVGKLVE